MRGRVLALVTALVSVSLCSALASELDRETRFSNFLRIRYEMAEQATLPKTSHAITAMARSALELEIAPKTNVLAEIEAVAVLLDQYDTPNAPSGARPIIPDERGIDLNRLQLQNQSINDWTVTLGRQTIMLDDERFIGAVSFRQNQQTYDAVTATALLPLNTTLDLGYIWSVNRFLGTRHAAGRLDSDSLIANVSTQTPIGRLSVFHYNLNLKPNDLNNPFVPQDLTTTGVQFKSRFDTEDTSVRFDLAYAEQNAERAALSGRTDYKLASLAYRHGKSKLRLHYEILSAGNNGLSFQTPLATNHKFHGKADKFVQTPVDGLRDTQILFTQKLGDIEWLRGVKLSLAYHLFEADRGGADYGDEFDIGVTAKINGVRLGLEFAAYQANDFGADTNKLWFTLAKRI